MDMDLNIDNYSINDLKKFFKLDDGFSHSTIEQKEYEIRTQLLQTGAIDQVFKRFSTSITPVFRRHYII